VTTVESAADALALLQDDATSYDLVLTDVLMPEADGFELLELIQTGLQLKTPVVMMSTDSGDVRLRSLRSGAASFLPKPVRPDQLQSLWQVAPSAQQQLQQLAGSAPSSPPHRSNSLETLNEAAVAAGMASAQVLLKYRAEELLARSAPGHGDAVVGGASMPTSGPGSTRVERLLKEREMRRVRSMTGLDADGASADSQSSPVYLGPTPGLPLGVLNAAMAAAAIAPPTPGVAPPSARDSGTENQSHVPPGDGHHPQPPLGTGVGIGVDGERQRLIVVANRLPVSAKRRPDGGWSLEISAGGLVSALLGIQQHYQICWVGWPGVIVEPRDQPVLTAALAKEGCVPVYLDADAVELYYNGYCNNVLWPLFHYVPLPFEARLDETNNVQAQWEAYRSANRLFGEAVLSQYGPGDCVWCHDYHLMLLPAVLREHVPSMKVGWFLHTPFPSSEIYRTLPLREELLHSVLKADLIGFHTYDYARHFVSACTRILGLEGTPEGVEDSGTSIRVAAFPIGIDPERFTRALDTEGVLQHIAELRRRFAGRKIMLGVDRLDMIKGIPQKLLGFEKFLEEHPEWRDRVLLVQIAVPTRTNVREYKRLANQVHEIVGRINGRFGSLASVPIHHLDRSLAFDELCALYAVTDVALVTSLRDGMNLVSYEYVACQSGNAGVLVLSEFAGAAQSLGAGAILVNPWNVRDMAAAIEDALTMSEQERRERHRQNFFHVNVHTAQAWADTFVSELNDTHVEAELRTKRIPPALCSRSAAQVFSSSQERLLMLGFNSTLTAAVEAPRRQRQQFDQIKSMVSLHPVSEQALRRLAADPHTTLCIVSGSERGRLEEFFGGLHCWLVAENGVFIRAPEHAGSAPGRGWVTTAEHTHLEWLESVQLVFDYFCERTPRSFVERRETSLVWNYKHSDPEFGRLQARDLLQHLWTGPISNAAVDVIQGSKSVEVRPTGISKGLAIERIMRDLADRRGLGPGKRVEVDFTLCVGHFLGRDEDIFTHLADYVENRGQPQPKPSDGDGARTSSSTDTSTGGQQTAPQMAPAASDASIDRTTSGGWWTQQKKDRRTRSRTGSFGGDRGSIGGDGGAGDLGGSSASLSAAAGGAHERVFTCTVGRKRSQARYYLNDSEEVASLLEDLCLTLPGATPIVRQNTGDEYRSSATGGPMSPRAERTSS